MSAGVKLTLESQERGHTGRTNEQTPLRRGIPEKPVWSSPLPPGLVLPGEVCFCSKEASQSVLLLLLLLPSQDAKLTTPEGSLLSSSFV